MPTFRSRWTLSTGFVVMALLGGPIAAQEKLPDLEPVVQERSEQIPIPLPPEEPSGADAIPPVLPEPEATGIPQEPESVLVPSFPATREPARPHASPVARVAARQEVTGP